MFKQVTSCRGCNSNSLSTICDLGTHYVVNFLTKEELEHYTEQPVPLALARCEACHLVQLQHSVDPDRMYKRFWYKSGINESMRRTLKDIVNDASKLTTLEEGSAVLDIGSNDGTLLSFYDAHILKVGFDPAENLVDEARLRADTPWIFCDYFAHGSKSYPKMRSIAQDGFKVITAIAMFYDLEDPRSFLASVRDCLHQNGVFVVQCNDLLSMLQSNAFDNIAHEHLCYYSFTVMHQLITICGMQVIDVERNNVNGGCIKVTAGHTSRIVSSEARNKIEAMLLAEANAGLHLSDTYLAFASRIATISTSIREFLTQSMPMINDLYLYGASTRGSTLMQFLGLPKGFVKGAAERNPEKYGLYMVGTEVLIISEEEARKQADMFLVLPWHFKSAILEREHDYTTPLLFPLPTPMVYSKYKL